MGIMGLVAPRRTTPLGFSNATKYSYPVLRDNKARVNQGGKILLPTSRKEEQLWRYTTSQPGAEWYQVDFEDNAWLEGPGGFGTPVPQSGGRDKVANS